MGLIRTLLALGVVSFHANFLQMGRPFGLDFLSGPAAVQCFYIISGFLMSHILATDQGSVRAFYRSRMLRLLPQYWIVLAAVVTTLAYTNYFETRWHWLVEQNATSVLPPMIFTNLTLIGMDVPVFVTIGNKDLTYLQPVYQAWTLGVELWFYAIVPFLVRRHTAWIALMIVASTAARLVTYSYGFEFDPWVYRFFPFELAWFLSGVLAHRAYVFGFGRWPATMKIGGIGAIVLVVLAITNVRQADAILWLGSATYVQYVAKAGLSQVLLIVCLPLIFAASKDWRLDRMLGLLSYPIYLCHLLLLEHFIPRQMAYSGEIGMVLTIVVAIGLVLAVSPIERWRHLRGRGQCRPARRSVGVDIGAVAGAGAVAAQVERPLRGGQ